VRVEGQTFDVSPLLKNSAASLPTSSAVVLEDSFIAGVASLGLGLCFNVYFGVACFVWLTHVELVRELSTLVTGPALLFYCDYLACGPVFVHDVLRSLEEGTFA